MEGHRNLENITNVSVTNKKGLIQVCQKRKRNGTDICKAMKVFKLNQEEPTTEDDIEAESILDETD